MASFSGIRSKMTTRAAPIIRAHWAAISPIGPAPKMTTVSPTSVPPARLTACNATAAGSVIEAASIETPSGTGTRFFGGTETYSANPPSRREP